MRCSWTRRQWRQRRRRRRRLLRLGWPEAWPPESRAGRPPDLPVRPREVRQAGQPLRRGVLPGGQLAEVRAAQVQVQVAGVGRLRGTS